MTTTTPFIRNSLFCSTATNTPTPPKQRPMMKVNLLIAVLLTASTAAAAAISSFSANTSILVNINLPAPPHPHPDPALHYDITCIEPSKDTMWMGYEDYWHTLDIFCRYLSDPDEGIEFDQGQVFGAADSLCNPVRCMFASAQYLCKKPKATVEWKQCMLSMQYPYQTGSEYHVGKCIEKSGLAMRGASTIEPTGCWKFSAEVHKPMPETFSDSDW
ncbi:hypothetical protein CB0940_11121 [Cercospora beticola]|uniref:Uncharacterized protein n=2 Tax=Cercospora beticola TaxID=122368 RepID=A0A2G5HDP5_CERBT|nr:hypothetical protein CB0940_11121 [Cercospora beticola]PIA90615.1 hypothetical protein CB0940_11121 [Cercospora beticola]